MSVCASLISDVVGGVAAGSVASSAAEVLPVSSQPPPVHFDVLVYGATSGGVTAAVAASRHRGVRVGMLVANGGGCGPSDAGANSGDMAGLPVSNGSVFNPPPPGCLEDQKARVF